MQAAYAQRRLVIRHATKISKRCCVAHEHLSPSRTPTQAEPQPQPQPDAQAGVAGDAVRRALTLTLTLTRLALRAMQSGEDLVCGLQGPYGILAVTKPAELLVCLLRVGGPNPNST